ncbi:hypothetical protein DPMN_038975 [Dreissena polymorpha]|uniref:Uncharacterized protein n=1 Tax=Dreissena polymorpha TaxID=45954 RepID=A0A9D4RR73_DREPO|nr:hypothetical protein DPMN_038975 [Dreissena polymorpha]
MVEGYDGSAMGAGMFGLEGFGGGTTGSMFGGAGEADPSKCHSKFSKYVNLC